MDLSAPAKPECNPDNEPFRAGPGGTEAVATGQTFFVTRRVWWLLR